MIKAIITDIEGTTSSISFVKDVLFPYARTNMAEFVRNEESNLEVQKLLQEVCKEVGRNLSQDEIIAQLVVWMDTDQKITPLKSLQGLIWAYGYYAGKLKGHIYPDVIPQLQHWQAQGLQLYVYSSGSIFAQKLLFGHTEAGDITHLFAGYFDTHIGNKKESASYTNIAASIGLPAAELLFLSDITEELDAAKIAGFHVCCLCREALLNDTSHMQVHSFEQIALQQF